MTALVDELPNADDQAAIAILRTRGYQIPDIQSLAQDQRSFAQRIPTRSRTIAPGISFHGLPRAFRTVD